MRRLALLAVFCVFVVAAMQAPAAPKRRPVAVAFDFESPFDPTGKWGRFVGNNFRQKLFRRGIYTTLDDVSFGEAVEAAGFKATWDTPPEKVARVLVEALQADLGIWGKITRPQKETYVLHVRAVRLVEGKPKVVLDAKFTCRGRHDIPPKINAALDKIEGVDRPPEVDLMATDAWKKRPNLVKNGGFEEGKGTPDFWEPMDGLSTFWVEGASPTGKCVMFDTDVDWDQYEAWHKVFQAGKGRPASEAPKPKRGSHYGSIGGTVGAHIYSDWIPIEQGATYRFDCDFKGPKTNSKVFIKGYAEFKGEFGFAPQRREVYRAPVWMHNEDSPDRWKHFARLFHPTQPLIVLGFESDFDGGKTGRALRDEVLKALKEKHDLIIASPDLGAEAVKKAKLKLTPDVHRREIANLVRRTYGRGMAVWGTLTRPEAGTTQLDLLGLDVRKETATKFYHDRWKESGAGVARALGARVADRIVELARPVRWLRVKLDCYWPPARYYFDNIRITKEPLSPAAAGD